ncbi:hypothetical protein [Phytoactinopolyspora halotolerans]|uniref:Uncharacterized protein n=1 Tax=Phytoactinopolyspora halotolerans TaxID=1981512 RepID=A0A6L9S6C2_9ACTN|nr:hypothetical protein [Phytoactinopolyspora halotolerans]NEE00311.1 hypothetical protein [Phytoactinopolyspora halotolerans]
MWPRLLAGTGAAALAAGSAFFLLGGADGSSDENVSARGKVVATGVSLPLTVPPSPAESENVEALQAEAQPPSDELELVLSAPEKASDWDAVPFEASWHVAEGGPVNGPVDLQRVEGESWESVTELNLADGEGTADVKVDETGIYRLAYGGSEAVDQAASNDVTVVSGDLLQSRITATASPIDDETAEVIATWTTPAGVAIMGDLELQRRTDDMWETVETVTTGSDSTAEVEVEAEVGTKFRFVYSGGNRFDEVKSDVAIVLGEDVETIPVSTCSTGVEIDNLAYGAACHYTPVGVGTFVVAHDYLGNAWWNAMPMGTMVELEGEQAGLYEVVNREIAPGRGSALGPASNWTCGDECDVILQTCQGSNTGFTWLRKVA